MDELYVIDALGYLFRSYYAIRNLSNPDGQATNALYGFIRSIIKLQNDFHPKQLVVVFDGPDNSQSRKAIYPQYKSNRSSPPEDLYYQIDWAENFCQLFGLPYLRMPGVEADDVMGSIALWAEKRNQPVYLCSSDKDLCQLISDKVKILNTHKNNLVIDKKEVEKLYGIRSDQMIDFLAICGDTSDNIPGISGFGPKTAATILQKIDSLQELLVHPEKVLSGKKLDTFLEEKEMALISHKLATIDTTLSFPTEESFYIPKEPQKLPLLQFFNKMGFRSLIDELQLKDTPSLDTESTSYHLINSLEDLQNMTTLLSQAEEIAFDTETTGLHPLDARIVGLGLCHKEKEAYYIPFNGALSHEQITTALTPIFSKVYK